METLDVKTMNLFEKMQLVSESVRNVEKNLTVGTGNSAYKAVADIDVLLAVKDAEKTYRLISIPVKQECMKSEIVRTVASNGYEKVNYVDVVKMTVRIVNIDKPSESVEVEALGRGLDAGDKGLGKASTYARKYALLNAYKIATGEDPDAVKSEQTYQYTQDDIRAKVINYMMANTEYNNNILSYYGVQRVEDLDTKAINSVYKNLTKKGVQL